MDSGSAHKVRLVRCPKCRLLLPEPADLSVYRCGGCGTVLQVKNRNNVAKRTTSGLHETEAAQMNELGRVFEVGECSSSSQKEILSSSGECSSYQNNGRDQKISMDCSTENSGDVNSSDEEQNKSDHNKPQVCGIKQSGVSHEFCSSNGDANHEIEDVNSSDEEQNKSDHNEPQVCSIKQPGVSHEFCSSNGDANHESEQLSQFARASSELELNDMSSLPAGAKLAVAVSHESDSTFRSSNTDYMARRENNSTITSHRQAVESISSDILISSPDEQSKQPQMSFNLSYDRREFFSPRSDFSSKTEYFKSKSPTIRSSHEYDGSVSSFDGTDDQAPDQHINLHRNTFQVLNSVTSEERSRRDKFLGNGNAEMQHQARKLSSALPGKRPYARDYRKWDGDELLGSTGHGITVSNGTRLRDDEFTYPLHFYQRDYPAGYESGSTSSQLQDEFHHHLSEQEKIKLLRMVYELQDQLNKTSVNENAHNRRISSGVTGKGKYSPVHYSCEIPQDGFSHDLSYHWYPERRRQISNRPYQHKVSPIPFSGKATNSSYHINSSCMQCYPQDWQCSVPLPVHFLSHNKGICRFHPGQSCSHSYSSCPSSPHHLTDSEFPTWCHETKSDDQRRGDYHKKKYMKEKHHLAKRHLRPTAGGAPFITCYSCLRPLQIPADFLVLRRRFHLLRCGGCSEVLKFSLEKKTHIVPYTPEAVAIPPSQLDDYSDAINRRNSVSSSHGIHCSPGDPVSCSDDYGLSYCRSCSTDGDPVILAQFQNHQGNVDARNMSYDSSESMKERPQFVLKQAGNKYKTAVETQESVGPSSIKSKLVKVSSEIEEVSAKKGSPLHRLMGYSSPSQVLRGSDPSGSGSSSNYT